MSDSIATVPPPQTDDVDLSIIIVSWNVWPLLQANLRALEQSSRALPPEQTSDGSTKIRAFGPTDLPDVHSFEIIVVDNASSDESPKLAPSLFPWIHFIQSGGNLGFTRGNNIGFSHAKGRFIYFLNPDTEVIDESVWTLYQAISSDPTIGVVGPKLQYGEGDRQNNRRRFPTRMSGFWESTWLGQFWSSNPWSNSFLMEDQPDNQRHDVDWLVGAAICVNRNAITEIMAPNDPGPFDEGFFMYSEELDLCKRIKDAGWRNVYIPEALVIHYEGRSSEQAVARRHIHFNTSKVRYYRKYFGPFWSEVLRRYLLLEFTIQVGLETLKKMLGHMPELRQQRIEVYRQVLASRLLSAT